MASHLQAKAYGCGRRLRYSWLRSLLCLRNSSESVAGLAQLLWWLLWPTVLSRRRASFIGSRFELADGWWGMLLALPCWCWHWCSRAGARGCRHPLAELFAPFQLRCGCWYSLHSGCGGC